MADVDAGYRVQGDERTAVVMAMVIGTLHQGTLWIKVAHFQIGADRCIEVAEDLSASRAVMNVFIEFLMDLYEMPYYSNSRRSGGPDRCLSLCHPVR